MSREFKFRAWLTEEKRMIPWDRLWLELEDGYGGAFEQGSHSSDMTSDFELMQYTGLRDKNGVEIWEGDVVRLRNSNGFHCLALVEFNDGCFELKYQWPIWEDGVNKPRGYVKVFVANHAIEVIGDIHTTPELLQGGAHVD